MATICEPQREAVNNVAESQTRLRGVAAKHGSVLSALILYGYTTQSSGKVHLNKLRAFQHRIIPCMSCGRSGAEMRRRQSSCDAPTLCIREGQVRHWQGDCSSEEEAAVCGDSSASPLPSRCCLERQKKKSKNRRKIWAPPISRAHGVDLPPS